MIFDDDFNRLVGSAGIKNPATEDDKLPEEKVPHSSGAKSGSKSGSGDITTGDHHFFKPEEKEVTHKYGNPKSDYVIESDLVTPKVEISKSATKPIIVYVEDDFDSQDLLKIYLQRNYEYQTFSNPKKAIFYLNSHVPVLVFLDCKINLMKAETFMEIVRTGQGNENTRFVLTGTKEELAQVEWVKTPEYVIGLLEVPVKRGELQKYLDMI